MNTTHAKGIVDQAKGKIKQAVGETFNNQKLANEGAVDQVKGHAEEAWGNVKEAGRDLQNRKSAKVQTDAEATGHDLRAKVTYAAESAKDSIDRGVDHLKRKG